MGELAGRLTGVERELIDTRDRLVSAEGRLSTAIERLVDRLEKSNKEMTSAIEKMTDGVASRLEALEKETSNAKLLARLAFSLLPLVGGSVLWFQSMALSFTREEVLLLKDQANDLMEHRRLGGVGDDWIHPARRPYKGSSQTRSPYP